MGKHIPPYDNCNHPIINVNDETTPLCYFNQVYLLKGETFHVDVPGYELAIVLASGQCEIVINAVKVPSQSYSFYKIGQRKDIWSGDPEAVYVPLNHCAEIVCLSEKADILIAGGAIDKEYTPFDIRTQDIKTVQYGSDETKTHRKIKHILGQTNSDKRGRLLVSELFTVGAGGWSGFPPHKHDTDRTENGNVIETRFEEVYQFRFNPGQGFGAQFLYEDEQATGDAYHVKTGSVIAIDKGYHPSVSAPGYEMYYFTIIVGETSQSLVQFFDPVHAYQIDTIPGIKDMIANFK